MKTLPMKLNTLVFVKAIDLLKKQLIKKKEATGLFGNQKDYELSGHFGQYFSNFWW